MDKKRIDQDNEKVNEQKKEKKTIEFMSNQSHLVSNPLMYNYYFGHYSNSSFSKINTNYYYQNMIYNSHQPLFFSSRNTSSSSCRFFIMKSFNEENIHKVINLFNDSQSNIEFGVAQLKEMRFYKMLIQKQKINIRFFYFLA